MRLLLSVLFVLSSASPSMPNPLNPEQQEAAYIAQGFLACGTDWAGKYADNLTTEPAADIAIAAAQKCVKERQTATQAIQHSFPVSDWNALVNNLDDTFKAKAIEAVLDRRMEPR